MGLMLLICKKVKADNNTIIIKNNYKTYQQNKHSLNKKEKTKHPWLLHYHIYVIPLLDLYIYFLPSWTFLHGHVRPIWEVVAPEVIVSSWGQAYLGASRTHMVKRLCSMVWWWDQIRLKQLYSVPYVACECLLHFLVMVITLLYIHNSSTWFIHTHTYIYACVCIYYMNTFT